MHLHHFKFSVITLVDVSIECRKPSRCHDCDWALKKMKKSDCRTDFFRRWSTVSRLDFNSCKPGKSRIARSHMSGKLAPSRRNINVLRIDEIRTRASSLKRRRIRSAKDPELLKYPGIDRIIVWWNFSISLVKMKQAGYILASVLMFASASAEPSHTHDLIATGVSFSLTNSNLLLNIPKTEYYGPPTDEEGYVHCGLERKW